MVDEVRITLFTKYTGAKYSSLTVYIHTKKSMSVIRDWKHVIVHV